MTTIIYIFNSPIGAILGGLIGYLIGNRLAIGRDKRKEFNNAAKPIRGWIVEQIKRTDPISKSPSAIELDEFTRRLTFLKRRRFWAAYKQQQKERNKITSKSDTGAISYTDPVDVVKYLHKCLGYTNLK